MKIGEQIIQTWREGARAVRAADGTVSAGYGPGFPVCNAVSGTFNVAAGIAGIHNAGCNAAYHTCNTCNGVSRVEYAGNGAGNDVSGFDKVTFNVAGHGSNIGDALPTLAGGKQRWR